MAPTLQKQSRRQQLWELYATEAACAGVPHDQFARFARAGAILNPRQLEFAATARLADSPDGPEEIGYGGARGGGKTHVLFAQIGLDDCQRFPGLKCLILRKSGKSNAETLNDVRLKLFMGMPHDFSAHKGTVFWPNGSRILTGHFQNEKDIDKYLGLEYDVIGVEEGTTLTRNKYRDIQTCCRTSKSGWRPRMYSNCNPGGVGHAWYRANFILPYRAKQEKRTRFIPALPTDNPYNNKEYLGILERLTGWQLRAWRFGDWDIAAGQFFTTFRRDIHGVDQFDECKATEWYLSLDYGFNHFTAVYLGARDGDGNTHVVDEHCERGWTVRAQSEGIKAMIARHKIGFGNSRRALTLGDIRARVAGADIFGVESDGNTIADDYKTHGIVLTPAVTDRVNGWAEVLKLLGDVDRLDADKKPAPIAPQLFINPKCVRLLDCLPALEHDPNRPEDVLKVDVDSDGNGGDDPGDSLRYMVATRAKEVKQRKVSGF